MSLVVATNLALPGRLQTTSLTLAAGTLTALVGPNGSGKTSLLHALARLGGAAGAVVIDGLDPETLGPARRARLLSFLPASRDLRWPIAARDLVALSGAGDAEVDAIVERLALGEFAERRADLLSTGERGRILIARALAPRPTLLLLDEPVGNLDPLWQIRMMELLRAEVAGSNRAALVALHDLDAAARYSDRLIVMHRGRVAADGVPGAVLAAPVIAEVFGIVKSPDGWRPAL